ncbi:dihydrolipoyl dehydrogenase family protein [Legionella brunensis]|uniref:Mercuric reductase n=1 Tax=Legionella brunensis TaxID=29422 RepID=A0A0W0SMA3_9GAMM|nr:FAD-dependent oxidoreductase [Legionella brunensis]KTC84502.1 hypothetical protein Lbru_1370 [Legionella brunensis]
MKEKVKCDLAILGAGAGGLSLAAGASQLGANVVLIQEGPMGGDCLNYGCIPSKSLLAAAKCYWQAHHSEKLGTVIQESKLDFKAVMGHVHGVINTIAVHDSIERFQKLGVRVIQAMGKFVDKSTLIAGDCLIQAKKIVIATGSSPAIPPIKGIEEVNYYTNETIFNLETLPRHLLIIGGGPIGCELAQAFSMLGAKVTLFEGAHILSQDDPECVQTVRESMQKTGVTILEEIQITQLDKDADNEIELSAKQNEQLLQFSGSHLLVATGRMPNIKDLACEKAGVTYNKKGICIDKRLRTANKRIFAMGDVTGHLQFTHVANYHASVVLRNILFKLPSKANHAITPWVTYTAPELAHVGKTEAECHACSLDYTILKIEYQDNDRAQTERETAGFIKLIINKKGKPLGVSIVGHLAGELLLPWVQLIREGKSLRSFTDVMVAYPTLSELNKRIASEFYMPKLFSSKVKMLVRLLSYF